MLDQTVNLPMLEAYMSRVHKRLRFPEEIEALYDQQMDSYRRKVMARGVLPTVLVYNTFLIADILLVPQTALIAAILHFALVTPAIFVAAFLYSKAPNRTFREVVRSLIPFMMLVQIMYIYAQNSGTGADQYQYLAVMTVIYMNITLRFGYRLAVASTLIMMAVYLAVLLIAHSPFEVKLTGASMMVAGAYLTLIANRRMEQDVRFGFLRRLQDQLKREGAEEVSKRDPMTGLANRRALDEVVAKLWADNTQDDALTAVVMIDVDYFKAFNDRYGHSAGDTCLKQVARTIVSELRNEKDLAVRFGGEEFLLLLPRTDMNEAVRVAERLRRQIEKVAIPHEELGPQGVVTASLGVAAGPVSAHSFSEMLSAADAALYAAKRNGRNQVWPPLISRDNPVVRLKNAAVQATARGR